MLIRESEKYAHLNWIAIVSYTASLAASLAIWAGVIRAARLLMK